MSDFFNPYDFANPVTNMAVLADRLHEREEIDYYLDLALTAPRHINMALVGQRASGKTSLLNYIEQAAHAKRFGHTSMTATLRKHNCTQTASKNFTRR